MEALGRIINAFCRKDNKILAQNFIFLSLMQIAGFVFPLITLPYLAKVVGADGLGRVAFASAINVWMQTIADWGFNYTATRELAMNRDDREKVNRIFSKIFWAKWLLALFSFVLLLLFIVIIPDFRENRTVILFTFLMIPGNIMVSEWFFQALEKMKYITLFNLLTKILFTLCVFLFVKAKSDYVLQPLFISLGFIVSGLISMYIILIRWKIRLLKFSFYEILETIGKSTDIFINNLMPNLYNSISTVLLGIYSTPYSVGIYSSGKKFITISDSMISIISRVFFPYLARRSEKHSIYAKLNISVVLIVTLLLFILAPLLIDLFYTEEFNSSINVLRITSLSLLFISLNTVYGTNFLLLHGYDRLLRNITMVASVIGLVLAVFLILYFDYIGAAFTYLFSTILMGVLPMYYAFKKKRCNL